MLSAPVKSIQDIFFSFPYDKTSAVLYVVQRCVMDALARVSEMTDLLSARSEVIYQALLLRICRILSPIILNCGNKTSCSL
jgi:hypothetical protein